MIGIYSLCRLVINQVSAPVRQPIQMQGVCVDAFFFLFILTPT